jgi:hypothetical protein
VLINPIIRSRTRRFVTRTALHVITKMNRLILLKEIIAVYCENHVKYKNTLGKMETN